MNDKKSILERLRIISKVDNGTVNNDAFENILLKSDYDNTDEEIEYEEFNEELNEELNEENLEVEEEEISDSDNYKNNDIRVNEISMDKVLSISEIYNKFNNPVKESGSVFVIDAFTKALPDNLPTDIKRQTVNNIISASKMDINNLLKDGENRLVILRNFSKEYNSNTEEIILEHQMQIEELSKKIQHYKELIKQREKLQSEQSSIIEYEVSNIENIINFINK